MNEKRRELIKRGCAIACAVILVVSLVASLFLSVASAATQQEIDENKKNKQEASEKLKEAEKEKAAIEKAIEELDKQIIANEDEIKVMENQVEITKEDIELKKEELHQAEMEQKNHEEAFKARARAMYEHSEIKYVEVLFSSDSFGDFLTKIDMITQIMEYDDKVLDDLKETKKVIDEAKKTLQTTLVKHEENLKKLEEKRNVLENSKSTKEALMTEARANVEKYKALEEYYEKKEQEFIEQNRDKMSYEANPTKYSGEGFEWPVPSCRLITSRYGYRIHPVYGYRKFHSGIDIGAGYGTAIVASAGGKVTMATTNGGYGRCIIINHGSGISTLYGHCSELKVSAGATVEKGQVIALVGSTGVSTGPHLHFEVRKNGETQDPLSYTG